MEKREMVYVPRRLEEEIRAKIDTYRRVKNLTEKISELNYRKLLKDKKKKD